MPLEAIAYTSAAAGHLSERQLEDLLVRAREKNRELGVTGVLLFHDGSFFQYFEGAPLAVAEVYERIRRSPLHHGLIELMRGPVPQRSFDGWLMGFTVAPSSTLLALANASWHQELRQTATRSLDDTSEGMGLLLQFWAGSGAAAPL